MYGLGVRYIVAIILVSVLSITLSLHFWIGNKDSASNTKDDSQNGEISLNRTSDQNDVTNPRGDGTPEDNSDADTSDQNNDGNQENTANNGSFAESSEPFFGADTDSNFSSNNDGSSSDSGSNPDSVSDPDPEPGPDSDPEPDPDPDPDPPVNQAPTAPNITSTVYQTGPSVLIRFTPGSDSDGSVVSHSLYRNGSFLTSTSSGANPIAIYDNAVSAGATYSYTARATDNDSAQSATSNTSSITVPSDVTPPSTPTNFRIVTPYDDNSCSVTLAWNNSTDNAVAQGDLWYILTSPLNESYFYTWTQSNPYTLWFCWDPGVHQVYIQATDTNNNSSKSGPVTITAP